MMIPLLALAAAGANPASTDEVIRIGRDLHVGSGEVQ